MSARQTLTEFCLSHRCETCPVNVPELAGGGGSDQDSPCVVSLAIDSLPEDEVES